MSDPVHMGKNLVRKPLSIPEPAKGNGGHVTERSRTGPDRYVPKSPKKPSRPK